MKYARQIFIVVLILSRPFAWAVRPEPQTDAEINRLANLCVEALGGGFRKTYKLKVYESGPDSIKKEKSRGRFIIIASKELAHGRREISGLFVDDLEKVSSNQAWLAVSPDEKSWLTFDLSAREYSKFLETTEVAGTVEVYFRKYPPSPMQFARENTLLEGDVIRSGRTYWLVLSRSERPDFIFDVGEFTNQIYTAIRFNRLPKSGMKSAIVETFEVTGDPYPRPIREI